MREFGTLDVLLSMTGRALAAVAASPAAARPSPALSVAPDEAEMTAADRRHAGSLMRVNHVGEVCAQALYEGQAMFARDPATHTLLRQAAQEESDHLAWTRERLDQLGASPSLLNPLWFAGAFFMGALASRLGDRASLGFLAETERQVEQHLAGHLETLPAQDRKSRAVVAQMRLDEARHARDAEMAGGVAPPAPVVMAMRAMARVMTRAAYHL
jgi:ubiquinone biosynthesis monooxygenase Coq7